MRQYPFAFRASIFASALAAVVALAGGAPQALAEKGSKTAPARLSSADMPADRGGSAMLYVPAAGRYAIRVKSPSGARIELVDMLEGPLDAAGAPGGRDGRIDALLDQGAYKLRVSGPKGASGTLRLSAEPFQELNDEPPPLAQAKIQSAELADLQQRSYRIEVGAEGRVTLEAIGRSLADLRLWRENGELVDLALEKRSAEPKPGRPMTRIRLEGAAAPGGYIVTAYGGEATLWSEGDKPQPFMIRLAPPLPLDAGVAEGTLGPFGSARFLAQPNNNAFRLEAPQPTPLRLDEWRAGRWRGFAEIAKNSRDAFATLRDEHEESEPATLEVSGQEGQAFTLHALHGDARFSFEASGPHLIGLDIAGQGADEVPATAIFARVEKDGKTRVLASDAPRIGPRRPWRGRFNLRGPTGLLFEMVEAGPVAIDAKGVSVRATIEPALSDGPAPRADGKRPGRYDLAKGFYLLSLNPPQGAAGVVDVTLGAPGVAAPEPAPTPARIAISFGEQSLERDGAYLILGNVAPELIVGPRVVALPADLSKGPLQLWQGAGEMVSIPVLEPKDGKIVARDSHGAEAPVNLGAKVTHDGTTSQRLTIEPTGGERALGLAFVANAGGAQAEPETEQAKEERPAKKQTQSAKKPGRAPLAASPGRPLYFDIGRDETQEIRFEAPEGGLYRVETLGRLKTRVAIASTVSANLGEGEDNGPAHNGLIVTYLRAGPYRAAVTVKDSAGRAGLAVSKVALNETAKLSGEGSARATLDPGKGAAIPFEIAEPGSYRLDLYGLGREWRARLEDKDGWPLAKPGPLTRLDRDFDKGAYRLVALPQAVEARLAFRLARNEAEKELSGHGPHPLPFEAPQKLQWREPETRGAKREPDVWRFSLKGDAEITLSLSEGMLGEIIRGENEKVGRVAAGRDFTARLPAGDYRVEARALASDDRLDYEISLSSKELQPQAPRRVELPAKLTFALAKEALVDLTSFGDTAFYGVLKNEKGEVVEPLAERANDWNIALARRLPAGVYRLSLHSLEVAAVRETPDEELSESPPSPEDEEGEEGKEKAQPGRPKGIEIRLAFPEERDEGALEAINSKTFPGKVAHVLALPPAEPDTLAMVVAKSADEVALSIERRDAKGAWRVVGARRGLSPFAAWPAPTDGSAWRVVAWTVGDGGAPIQLAYRDVDRTGERPGEIALNPVANAPVQPCVGLTKLVGPSVVEIGDWPFALVAGSTPGQLLQPVKAGALASQSQSLWLASDGDCRGELAVSPLDWRGEEIALDLGPGEIAVAPRSSAPSGKARLFLAKSLYGRVGLDAGRGMAVAQGATLALAGDAPLHIWNAGGGDPLRLALRAVDVTLEAPERAEGAFHGTLAPWSAKPVALTLGEAPLALELPAGVAVFSAPDEPTRLALYGGGAALAATHHGAGKSTKLWLVNLSGAPAPVSLQAAPGARQTLDAPRAIQGFLGASGEIIIPVAPQKGDVLVSLGGAARFVSASGAIREGARIALDGPGTAILDHAPGLEAIGLERDGKGPWPEAEAKPVRPPQRVTLSGASARFSLKSDTPALLVASGSAPAIARFAQNGRRDLEAFPNGVRLSRFFAAGEAALDLYSPHDGPLSGALDLSFKPAIGAHEGINEAATVAPGSAALYFFDVKNEAEIGLGLRSDPDRVTTRLFSKDGDILGEGVAQKKKLSPGRYYVEVRAPATAATTVVRLSLFGLSPPPAGPPDEVVADYLDKAGLKKSRTR